MCVSTRKNVGGAPYAAGKRHVVGRSRHSRVFILQHRDVVLVLFLQRIDVFFQPTELLKLKQQRHYHIRRRKDGDGIWQTTAATSDSHFCTDNICLRLFRFSLRCNSKWFSVSFSSICGMILGGTCNLGTSHGTYDTLDADGTSQASHAPQVHPTWDGHSSRPPSPVGKRWTAQRGANGTRSSDAWDKGPKPKL